MLKSTGYLLLRIHIFFDEIGYKPTSENYDDNKVLDNVVNTINHSKNLEDAIHVLKLYNHYVSKRVKFINKYHKYPKFWNAINYNGRQEVAVVSDDEAIGRYYITNIYGNSYKDIFVSGQSLGNELFEFQKRGRYFSIEDDADYYLSYAALSSKKMALFDKSNKKVAVIVITEDLDIYLENNKTKYELIAYEAGIAFFDKTYIYSIKGEPDLEKCKAFIQWDIVNEDGEYGLSRLDVFDEDADLELMITIAASCFLVFRSYIKDYAKRTNRKTLLSAFFLANVLSKRK